MTKKRVIRLKTPDSARPLGEGQIFVRPLNGLRRAMMARLNTSKDSDDDSKTECEDITEKEAGEQ